MKKTLHIFTLIFSIIILVSCEPSRAENGDLLNGLNENLTGNTTTKLLKKLTVSDDSGSPVTINYFYDGIRLVSVTTSDNSSSYEITYDGDFISQIVYVNSDQGESVTSTLDLLYDGKILKKINEEQDTNGEIIKSVTDITYDGMQLSQIKRTTFTNDTPPKEALILTSDLTFSGPNVSKWILTTESKIPVIPKIVLTANITSYDDKKNPFSQLPKEFNIATLHFETSGQSILGFCKNNPKKITVAGQTADYIYVYDSDGYPVLATVDDETLKYEYY